MLLSDESTRQQEHEAAYGLLSLSQKTSPSVIRFPPNDLTPNPPSSPRSDSSMSFMNTEEIAHMTKKNFAKNKILDQQAGVMFSATKRLIDLPASTENSLGEHQNFSRYLGKTSVNRPLTYPYTTPLQSTEGKPKNRDLYEDSGKNSEGKIELKSIRHFQVTSYILFISELNKALWGILFYKLKIIKNRNISLTHLLSSYVVDLRSAVLYIFIFKYKYFKVKIDNILLCIQGVSV